MNPPAARVKPPEWVMRVDPVAWFPVVAFVILAALCVLAGNIWLALGATFVAASIVVLEAVVFGSDWVNERAAERAQRRPALPAPDDQPTVVVPRARPATPPARQLPPPVPAPRRAPQSAPSPGSQPYGPVPQGPMPHGQARV